MRVARGARRADALPLAEGRWASGMALAIRVRFIAIQCFRFSVGFSGPGW